jgi:hypothetical protein
MPSILSVTISSIVSGFCPDPVLFPFESGLAVFAEGPFSLKNNCSIPHLYETFDFLSAPPYRTGMLIGDTSRQHYSRERTQAGHRSYEGNNTGKLQQNMTLESSTNDFREKEESQTSHTGVE